MEPSEILCDYPLFNPTTAQITLQLHGHPVKNHPGIICQMQEIIRVGSPVIAPALGAGGRRFGSFHPDSSETLSDRHRALLY